MTDFHYDHTYLDNAISCEKNASGRGMYGHSWCDSPWKLITSSIDAMHINKADVDFIIWTGYVKIKCKFFSKKQDRHSGIVH